MKKIKFISGKPIWVKGRETEKNLFVGFRTVIKTNAFSYCILRIAASSLYRMYLNNEFVGHGPARGPHGYYRLDEWDLKDKIKSGKNVIAIEVAGYNSNGYYLINQPSFLQAEIICDGNVIASTNGKGKNFNALILTERVQKVQRFSFQRPFIEVYNLKPKYTEWREKINAVFHKEKCTLVEKKKLIPRGVSYPRFSKRPVIWDVTSGKINIDNNMTEFQKDRELTDIGPLLIGYKENELDIIPSIDLQKIKNVTQEYIDKSFNNQTITLKENSYHIVDLGTNLTGFIGARINCKKITLLYIVFDEILSNNDVDFQRGYCVNCVTYIMNPGKYEIESFEPYGMRYLKFIAVNGECVIDQIYLREYTNPDVYESYFSSSDHEVNKLFDAAKETFRQNALDIFMDCPSRERAGWLCDSFFTSRVAMNLSGHTKIERNFFENFLLPKKFPYHPEGMLPMCYPADHYDGRFIPNWAMWFVIELEEYLYRSGDRKMVDELKPKVVSLFDYFKKFHNEYGLLEKLEQWIFVEWSKANEFIDDVNYPTNMVYAGALEAAGRIYNIKKYFETAKKIKQVIREQSFNGQFFIDNAVRKNGKLEKTNNRTEVCQYYAFFFGIASLKTHQNLWNVLKNEFGPTRDITITYPDIHMANAFIGNYLRLELLSQFGCAPFSLKEIKDYFLFMANRTGTLWEHRDTRASCNHGFASHICHILYRDILGINKIDYQHREIILKFCEIPLNWCEGHIPIGNDFIKLKWWKKNNKLYYKLIMPLGYKFKVIPEQDLEIVQVP